MKKSLNITAKREQRLHIDLNKVQTGKHAHHLPDLQSLRTPRTTTLADSTDLSNQSLFHKKGEFSLANSAIPGLRLSEAFQGNDSRVKSFTIEQIQPFTSGSQTTRVNFTEKKKMREKKIVLWENIAMIKSHFEKYPLSLRNNGIASKLDTVTVFKFLKALQESDEDFEGVIDTIVAALKSLIYINYDTIEYYLNEQISEADDDLRKLFLTFYQPNSTYHKVCAELMKAITFKNNDRKFLEEKFSAEIQRIEDKCAEKDVIIEELNQQLQSTVSDEAYKGSIQQIDEIKEYYQSIAIENEELKRKYQALEESHTLLRTQYNEEVKQTEKYEEKIRNLKNEKTILISQSDKAKDAVNETQNKVQGLKDVMDKILVRLALVKKDIVDLRQQNIVLENENRKLNIRAAQGFDALSPRPDYKRLQGEKNIDLDIYDESGKTQLASTSDIVNKLVDEIIDLQNKLKAKTINFNVKNANGPSRKQSNADLTEASLKAKNKRGSSIHSLFKTNLQRNNSDNRASFINQQEPNETKSTDNHQQSDKSSTNEQNSEQLDPDFGVSKPTKSKFATSKFKIEISQELNKNEFGVETIEKAQSVMKDVIEIKNTLKNLF